MYKIISEGEVVALCDEPRYIKVKATTGAFIQTTKDEAQGIAAGGNVYNLPGHTEITVTQAVDEETVETVAAPEAYVVEIDGGELIFAEGTRIDGNEVRIEEAEETAITGLMATTDLYEELLEKGVL